MKTNNYLIIILFLLTGSLISNNLYAQENLEKWFKKCESNKALDMSFYTRNQSNDDYKSKEITTRVKVVNNPELYNEFLNAFEKDKENAKDAVERRVNGVIKPSYCEFRTYNSDKEFTNTTYSIRFENNGDFTVSKIYKTTYQK